MAKEKLIKKEAIIIKELPNLQFRVIVKNSNIEILCYTSGKMKRNKIEMSEGDEVLIEMSPYDLTRGRIIWRK